MGIRTTNGTRSATFAEIFRRVWVRCVLVVWALFSTYDTFVSQLLPSATAEKFPRLYDFIVMSTGFLPFWGWILILAVIIAAASFEYAHRTGAGNADEILRKLTNDDRYILSVEFLALGRDSITPFHRGRGSYGYMSWDTLHERCTRMIDLGVLEISEEELTRNQYVLTDIGKKIVGKLRLTDASHHQGRR